MNPGDKYLKIVEWSEADQCFIGTCPELIYSGCHGDDPRAVFDQLCRIVNEALDLYIQDGKTPPPPQTHHEFINSQRRSA